MEVKFNVTGNERKELVAAIAEITGEKPRYKGVPSCAYQIGCFIVDRVGTLTCENETEDEKMENLLTSLTDMGHTGAVSGNMTATVKEQPEASLIEPETNLQSDEIGLTISMPADYFTEDAFERLEKLIVAKGTLIKRALGIDELPIEKTEEKVTFPWFKKVIEDADAANAYIHFIYALCEMARNQKRISVQEREVENEKYAFRCFLLRLGFIGEKYKVERKILLKNLTGSSAFKNGENKHCDSEEV